MSDKIAPEDLAEIYDELWRQLKDDRDRVVNLYNDLKSQVTSSEHYAIHGLVLSKLAELTLKQTEQLVEVININQKNVKKSENTNLDEEDRKKVYNMIKNGS